MVVLFLTTAILGAGNAEPSDAPPPTPAVESGILRFYRIGEKECEFVVMPDDVRGTPAWKESMENPPVSARAAIAKAAAALESVSKQLPLDARLYPKNPWGFESLKLVPLGSNDRWIWIVSYRAIGHNAKTPALQIEIAVLMNGEVVKPKVKKQAGHPE